MICSYYFLLYRWHLFIQQYLARIFFLRLYLLYKFWIRDKIISSLSLLSDRIFLNIYTRRRLNKNCFDISIHYLNVVRCNVFSTTTKWVCAYVETFMLSLLFRRGTKIYGKKVSLNWFIKISFNFQCLEILITKFCVSLTLVLQRTLMYTWKIVGHDRQ